MLRKDDYPYIFKVFQKVHKMAEAQLGGLGSGRPPLDGQGGQRPPLDSGNFLHRAKPHQSKNQILQILIAHAPPTPPLQKGGGSEASPCPPPGRGPSPPSYGISQLRP